MIHPSTSYQKAQQRFDDILREKLGVYPNTTGNIDKIKRTAKTQMKSQSVNTDVRVPSRATAQQIDEALKGTRLAGLGASFIKAEQKHGVNAWFLAALAAHESGFGESQIAKDKNNLFGFQAYDSSPYQSARSFHSVDAGIDHVASYLSSAYLNPGGAHYHGTAISDIGQSYATDPAWADKVSAHMERMMTSL